MITRRWPSPSLSWIVVGVLFASGAYSLFLSWTNPLDEDEMYQLHQGWEIANGYVPFVDFDAFNVSTASIASLGFRVAGNRFAGVRLDRGLALIFYLGACYLMYRIGVLFFSRRAALLAVFAWTSLGHVILKSHEFRPIHFALFLSLAALYLYLADRKAGRRRRSTFFAIGVLSALAFLVKPDSVIMLASILLVEAGSRIRALDKGWVRDMVLTGAGILCVLGLFLAALGDPDRIVRYLFFQYRFLFFVASIVETTWQKGMVFRLEYALPVVLASVTGLAWLLRRIHVPGVRIVAAWMVVYGSLAFVSLSLRPIYFQHNLFFPSLVPVFLAGLGLDFLLRLPLRSCRAAGWILATVMVGAGVVSVVRWNHQGILGSKIAFHRGFERVFPEQSLCMLPGARYFGARELFQEEKPSCKLSLEDHRGLFRFLAALQGESLTVYDGFEAALPVRGVPYLDGFVPNAFHEVKYQKAYDVIRKGEGWLLRRMREKGWRQFEDMTPVDAWEALVKELEENPPSIVMMDSFLWRLTDRFPGYRYFLESHYDFCLVSHAHSIVGLRKEIVRLPEAVASCAP